MIRQTGNVITQKIGRSRKRVSSASNGGGYGLSGSPAVKAHHRPITLARGTFQILAVQDSYAATDILDGSGPLQNTGRQAHARRPVPSMVARKLWVMGGHSESTRS
jgi:hypothetical protein